MKLDVKSKEIQALIKKALCEDLGECDLTSETLFTKKDRAKAVIIAKENGVLAGLDVAAEVFLKADPDLKVKKLKKDSDEIQKGDRVFSLSGSLLGILKAERTALNFLQRMTGVATVTNKYVLAAQGTKTKIYDTRKTIPGWRVLDKYAVRAGGANNHRMGLFDGILLKENHLYQFDKGHSAAKAIRHIRNKNRNKICIIIEVHTIPVAIEAARAAADIIMFDNFSPARIRNAMKRISKKGIIYEASGGITLRNIKAYTKLDLDRISIGALTHSTNAIDFTLLVI